MTGCGAPRHDGQDEPTPAEAHACVECGRLIRGHSRKCGRCRAVERACDECGTLFRSVGNRKCPRCSATDRACASCGKGFRGKNRLCQGCQASDRECAQCGVAFSGKLRLCGRCATPERECAICGKTFRGTNSRCGRCLAAERTCVECGSTFRGRERACQSCRSAVRECVTCGKTFKGVRRECGPCSGRDIAHQNARRARRRAAEVSGPLPRSVYQEVISSGPCVYCGLPATTADHVRPLARGGHEAACNLVPACAFCNNSKNSRLLTQWNPQKVTRAAACSPVVAAELARLGGAV